MFAHEFVRNAYLAGTFVALACGTAGWFVVLRAQIFAGDALSHVAFVGAIAAAVIGLDQVVGIFVLTLALALVYLGEHYVVDLLAGLALTETVRRQAPRAAPLVGAVSRVFQRLEVQAGSK